MKSNAPCKERPVLGDDHKNCPIIFRDNNYKLAPQGPGDLR